MGKRERESGSTRVAPRRRHLTLTRATARPRACGCLSGSVPSLSSRASAGRPRADATRRRADNLHRDCKCPTRRPSPGSSPPLGGAFASPIDRPARRILPTRRDRDVARSTRCLGSCRDARLVVLARIATLTSNRRRNRANDLGSDPPRPPFASLQVGFWMNCFVAIKECKPHFFKHNCKECHRARG